MSQRIRMFERVAPKEEEQDKSRWKMLILIICWFVLLLIVVALYATALGWTPMAEKATTASAPAVNPGLMVAERYTGSMSEGTDAELYARNPELRALHRFTAEQSGD